jgi:hypothetical protein
VLFAELRGVLHRPKFALLLTTAVPPATPLTVMLRHQAITTLVTSELIERTVPTDADDAVSMLAPIAIAVNATVAELLEEPAPTKSRTRRGPTPVLQRQLEQVATLPRARQKVIHEMLDALINQQQAS